MSKSKPSRRNAGGFTLMELMVTLAIAAIVVTVGVPSFKESIDNQRMTNATNELVMSLNLAKSEAIKRVAYVSVCKSSDGASCTGGATTWSDGWIVFANDGVTNLGSVEVGEEIIRVYSAVNERLAITPTGTVDTFISFRPSGTVGTNVANLIGTLTMCDQRGADHANGILVEPSGRWEVSHDKAHDDTALTCS